MSVALAMLLPGAAIAASVTPDVVGENPNCSSLGLPPDDEFKIDNIDLEPLEDKSYGDEDFSVDIDNVVIDDEDETKQFDWLNAVPPVNAVIVKGGDDANVYRYDAEDSDTELVAPEGKGISHVTFCYVTGGDNGEADSDGDGVPDDDDLCPGTPEGEEVDEDGCSESQLDDDEDGVPNDRDLCPGTPAGEEVDDDGCSESQPAGGGGSGGGGGGGDGNGGEGGQAGDNNPPFFLNACDVTLNFPVLTLLNQSDVESSTLRRGTTEIALEAADADDGDVVVLSTPALPSWMSFEASPGNPAVGSLVGSPRFFDWLTDLFSRQSGFGGVEVLASDGQAQTLCFMSFWISLIPR